MAVEDAGEEVLPSTRGDCCCWRARLCCREVCGAVADVDDDVGTGRGRSGEERERGEC